jgi:hypothetical protein
MPELGMYGLAGAVGSNPHSDPALFLPFPTKSVTFSYSARKAEPLAFFNTNAGQRNWL